MWHITAKGVKLNICAYSIVSQGTFGSNPAVKHDGQTMMLALT